jgi:hypothetical protein
VLKEGIPDTSMAMFHFTDEQRWAMVCRVMESSKENAEWSLVILTEVHKVRNSK